MVVQTPEEFQWARLHVPQQMGQRPSDTDGKSLSDESASPANGRADITVDGAASGAAVGGAASEAGAVVEDDAPPVVARVAALRSKTSASSSSMRLMRLFPGRLGGGVGRPRKGTSVAAAGAVPPIFGI
eukprot:6195470-Pleurochrysis_carterae.AAC.1